MVALVACSTEDGGAPPGSAAPTVRGDVREVAVVASGLDAPWSIAFHGGAPLVSERDAGRIVEIGPGGRAREVAVVDGVAPRGEGGLLGLAARDGFLYAYYTAANENRVDRFPITGVPGSLGLGPAERILDGLPAANYHNGGRIAFGPDGMLYIASGDAGNRGDAQDLGSSAGKILRLTAAGDVPTDNPFPGSPVYSLGHRNVQGLAWDAAGRLFASEFGQNTWDELNIVRAGANYGWPEVEGIARRDGFVDPVQQWGTDVASPSGIAIRAGVVHIANLRGERLRDVPVADPGGAVERMVGEHGRLRDAVVAPGGDLWVLTNNTDGRGDPADGDDRILRVAL
nr:PQQ-dependent sugar dehydrogenase [Tsukamurella sp. 1534]